MRNKQYFGGVSPYRQKDDEGYSILEQKRRAMMGVSNNEPIGSKDPVVIPMDSLLIRQQFKESGFDSSKVSKAGATSIAQITRKTFGDGIEKGYVPKDTKYEDLAKNDELAAQFQKNYMYDLTYKRHWNRLGVKSANEKIQRAKALGAYNAGPTRIVDILNEMRDDGYDIYSSLDWVEDLPKYHKYLKGLKKGQPVYESRDYIKKILFGDDEKRYIETSPDGSRVDTVSFEDRLERAYDRKFLGGVSQ